MSARWWPRRVIVQLRGQQADLIRQEADLASKYGPLHPKLQAVQAQKRDLDAKIAQEVSRIAGSLGNDVAATQAHLNSLEQSLGQVERQANGQNQSRVRIGGAAIQCRFHQGAIRSLCRAPAPDRRPGHASPRRKAASSAPPPCRCQPSAPKRGLIVGASIPLGLLLGLLAALLSENFGYAMPVPVRGAPRRARATVSQPRAAPRRAKWPPKRRLACRCGTARRSWPNWPMPRSWARPPMSWIIPPAAMPRPWRRW